MMMKRLGLLGLGIVAVGAFAVPASAQTDTNVTGDLTVEGDSALKGSVGVGSITVGQDEFSGVTTTYTDGTDDVITHGAYRLGAMFEWWDNLENSSSLPNLLKMRLDGNNTLSLYDRDYDAVTDSTVGIIELIPAIVSDAGASMIKIDGNEVLVKGGDYTQEDLFGTDGSLAVGASAATGAYVNAIALGEGAKAAADGQVVVGKFNEPSDLQAFQVGGGTDDANRSNAFTVDSDGDTRVNGNLYVAKNTVVDGTLYVKETGGLSMGQYQEGARFGFADEIEAYVAAIEAGGGTVPTKIRLEQLEDIVAYLKAQDVGGTSLWSRSRLVIANSLYNTGNGTTIYGLGGLSNNHFIADSVSAWSAAGVDIPHLEGISLSNPGVVDEYNRTMLLYAQVPRGKSGDPATLMRRSGVFSVETHEHGKIRWPMSADGNLTHDFDWSNAAKQTPWIPNHIMLAFQYTSDTTTGTGKVWMDAVNYNFDLIYNYSRPYRLYPATSGLTVYFNEARDDSSAASFRAFLYSDLKWTETQIQDFQSMIKKLDWE